MRISLLFFISFIFNLLTSLAQINDNFTDGDFTSNPTWSGDNSSWAVNSEKLQSNSSVASSAFYLSTASTLATSTQWEFLVNLQFNTSSANYVDVFLTASAQDLKSNLNGYFVRIGNTADEISLYKKSGATSTVIIDGVDKTTNISNLNVKIKVTRDASNLWTLSRDLSGTGSSYTTEGSVTDASFTSSSYFGIVVQQSTASFFNKHFFDDIYVGSIIVDILPPTVNSVSVIDSTKLDIKFSENISKNAAETTSNYTVTNGLGNPISASLDAVDKSLVHLTFSTAFSNGTQNTITISNIQDVTGNSMAQSTHSFTYFKTITPTSKSVIFNEIFPDPTPVVGLPE